MTATVSDETGREALQSPQHIIEGIILRRLHDERIEGYTLEMSKEIAAALSAAPVAQEPGLNWQISQEARDQIAEIERNIRETSINVRNIVAGSTTPPATPAGVGADEIALREARASFQRIIDNRNNKNWRKPELIQEAERGLKSCSR